MRFSKAVVRGKFIALNPYVGKKWFHINHLSFQFMKLEKRKINLKQSEGKEIIKVRVHINKI